MSHVIAAVSTGTQITAIGIIRMSGDGCIRIADQLFSPINKKSLLQSQERKMVLGYLRDKEGRTIDQCVAVISHGPHSYTGEDTVEFHCHGSPAVLAAGLEALYHHGALPAKRGEFTKRAFLNGRMDLTQAEAVIDLIEAETVDAAANAAGQVSGVLQQKLSPIYQSLVNLCSHFHAVLDYPDEDIEDFGLANYSGEIKTDAKALYKILKTYQQGSIMKHGAAVAIVGKPNVGKSSLLNTLAGFDRAIVTDIPGTTRDTIEQSVLVGNTRLRLIDTAGIHYTQDTVETIGIERAKTAIQDADLAIFLCDGSTALDDEDRLIIELCLDVPNTIAIINKTDLGSVIVPADLPFSDVICISLKENKGIEQLSNIIDNMFTGEVPCDGSLLTNARQFDACRRAYEAMLKALQGLALSITPDAVLLDIEEAMEAMGEVTGATIREDITARIFERFCVGK